MRIINRKTLVSFWSQARYSDAELPLKTWWLLARSAKWATPQAIKDQFAHASIVGGDRAVFNIGGNKYRLVVRFNFALGIGYIRFVGTHRQYDRVDVETI